MIVFIKIFDNVIYLFELQKTTPFPVEVYYLHSTGSLLL